MKTNKIAVPRYLADRLPGLTEKYLSHDQELPEALIREIAQWCYESYGK